MGLELRFEVEGSGFRVERFGSRRDGVAHGVKRFGFGRFRGFTGDGFVGSVLWVW